MGVIFIGLINYFISITYSEYVFSKCFKELCFIITVQIYVFFFRYANIFLYFFIFF